ncbi:MAG: YaiO family outer membrane beta-barrel protein [Acidiferrobacter sp.]
MTAQRRAHSLRFIALLAVMGPGVACAHGWVGAGGSYYRLTQGYGRFEGVYARGVLGEGSDTIWNWEVDHGRTFGYEQSYGVLGVTQTFAPRWYGYLSLAGSTNSDVVPKDRVDASLSYKALPDKRLVGTVGYTGIRFRDGHDDRSGWVNLTAYLPAHWVATAGHNWTTSDPGAVQAQRSFAAVGYDSSGRTEVTLRYGWGTEAYLPIGANVALVDFRSHTLSVTWRQWLGADWGTDLFAARFASPYYRQIGGSIGVFYHF